MDGSLQRRVSCSPRLCSPVFSPTDHAGQRDAGWVKVCETMSGEQVDWRGPHAHGRGEQAGGGLPGVAVRARRRGHAAHGSEGSGAGFGAHFSDRMRAECGSGFGVGSGEGSTTAPVLSMGTKACSPATRDALPLLALRVPTSAGGHILACQQKLRKNQLRHLPARAGGDCGEGRERLRYPCRYPTEPGVAGSARVVVGVVVAMPGSTPVAAAAGP